MFYKTLLKMIKNILSVFIFILMFSCSNDENNTSIKETTVKVLFKNNSLTNKNIQRGLIPVTVDFINIHTQKSGETLFIDYPFTLVENGTAGAETEFILKNFQTGIVNFSVFTNGPGSTTNIFGQGNGNVLYGERMVVVETGSLQAIFDKYSVKKPGIVFTASGTKEMIAGINEPITFNLKPIAS